MHGWGHPDAKAIGGRAEKTVEMIESRLAGRRSSARGIGRATALFVLLALTAAGCARRVPPSQPPPPAASGMRVTATAYCKGTLTATGTKPAPGIIAADPALLPFGTRIRLTGLDAHYNGVYTVRDTGANIRGHRIDVFMNDCSEARRFGRRDATVAIVK
jgi:3D (Asp-Asp-Asp) domain-containing protein